MTLWQIYCNTFRLKYISWYFEDVSYSPCSSSGYSVFPILLGRFQARGLATGVTATHLGYQKGQVGTNMTGLLALPITTGPHQWQNGSPKGRKQEQSQVPKYQVFSPLFFCYRLE